MIALSPQFVDMNGWLLLSSDRQEVPTTLSLREQLVHADLKNLLDAYQELYWVAPSSYLGDQVSKSTAAAGLAATCIPDPTNTCASSVPADTQALPTVWVNVDSSDHALWTCSNKCNLPLL